MPQLLKTTRGDAPRSLVIVDPDVAAGAAERFPELLFWTRILAVRFPPLRPIRRRADTPAP